MKPAGADKANPEPGGLHRRGAAVAAARQQPIQKRSAVRRPGEMARREDRRAQPRVAASGNKKLFLSAVSGEFLACRKLLAGDLKRPGLDIAMQEDFIDTGASTLESLDAYIRECDAVVHLIGKDTGSVPDESAVAELLDAYPDLGKRLVPLAKHLRAPQPGFSYTQWEAYLALYHACPLFAYRPADFDLDVFQGPRDAMLVVSAAQSHQLQQAHYRRVSALGRFRGQFLNEERLSSAVLRDLVDILPRLESVARVSPTRLRHGAERLIGRDHDLTRLDSAWNDAHKNMVIVRAGGGVGKTSLVATWMAELALKGWRGAERVYDWSFYSQGAGDQVSASAEIFIADALQAFDDPDPTQGSPWDRGARLAGLVARSRCLLVLDGLEPLQHSPGSTQGRLKDQGVEALLKGLAARNEGLCVVTTREKVDDIKQHYGRSADDFELSFLSDLAGAALLHHAGARRAGAKNLVPDAPELQAASRELHGHALTLQLLGQYQRLAEDGDLLKRSSVRVAGDDEQYLNDATHVYAHTFETLKAYEKWFAAEGEKGQRQLAILRLLGLFDRPASRSCLESLRAPPVIAGLTDSFFAVESKWIGLQRIFTPISVKDWKLALSRLEKLNLIAVQTDGCVDCQPMLREYFRGQLRRSQPEAWRSAHRRIYEHLCANAHEEDHPTLEDLQPLYQAVAHGCLAGLQQDACDKVYFARIVRREESYSTKKLGAFGSDLEAIACFFETPWCPVSPALRQADQAWLLNEAAYRLRTLGRLTEALEPMRTSREMCSQRKDWKETAVRASKLSELELALGDVTAAVADAEQSVTCADRSGDVFQQMGFRTTHADALHQAGFRDEAYARLREAEQMQAERQAAYPLLYSIQGFRYCDLLLAQAERAAWQVQLGCAGDSPAPVGDPPAEIEAIIRRRPGRSANWPAPFIANGGSAQGTRQQVVLPNAVADCLAVEQRGAKMFQWRVASDSLLTIALDHLTLGRAQLYRAILEQSDIQLLNSDLSHIEHAVDGLRRAGRADHLPRGLLTRAWLRSLTGARTGSESAQSDLDEAWEIAARGPMPLFFADIHLYRARLFGRSGGASGDAWPEFGAEKYPWQSSWNDLAEARRLIENHGYFRRKEELEDAQAVARSGASIGEHN